MEGVRFGDLDPQQTARMTVFQYLIGNKDWSFVTAHNDNRCCHNVDLLEIGTALYPLPYDFDLAALTRASYPGRGDLNVSKSRTYTGYCKTPQESLEMAVEHVQQLRQPILDTILQLPALEPAAAQRRASFAETFFEEATDRSGMLAKFDRDCIGSR